MGATRQGHRHEASTRLLLPLVGYINLCPRVLTGSGLSAGAQVNLGLPMGQGHAHAIQCRLVPWPASPSLSVLIWPCSGGDETPRPSPLTHLWGARLSTGVPPAVPGGSEPESATHRSLSSRQVVFGLGASTRGAAWKALRSPSVLVNEPLPRMALDPGGGSRPKLDHDFTLRLHRPLRTGRYF